ncbi:hypothetical protein DL96DRAFT_1719455 [Flagelloscypha sp. PMI_526]|nr:hypothetical protein DL96DRAFT_1719455 [Flagelloscypha sp. PMI_526]
MPSQVEIIESSLVTFFQKLDTSVLASHMDDSFKGIVLPPSLGMKENTKEEHLASGANMKTKIKEYSSYEILEIFESGKKVTTHVRSTAVLNDGTEWKNDSIYIITFNDAGKIVYLKEFADALALSQVAAKLMA